MLTWSPSQTVATETIGTLNGNFACRIIEDQNGFSTLLGGRRSEPFKTLEQAKKSAGSPASIKRINRLWGMAA